ncbi:MAG: hypothetical protein ACE5IP_07095 [Terriglobia bacterium]
MGAALLAALPGAHSRSAGFDAKDFPARDSHQGVTIAAVPVPDTPEAEALFGKTAAPTRAGILPVELILTNERKEPVRVALERIVIVTEEGTLSQVDPEEIAWSLYPAAKKKKKSPRVGVPRLPGRGGKGKKRRQQREEAEAALRRAALRAAVVAPGGGARGYRYFDLRGRSIELATSAVYVPEVTLVPGGEQLLFFEISLRPYANKEE